MVKFAVLFHRPLPDRMPEFETYYTRFLALIEQIPDIARRQVVDVMGSPEGQSKYYRVLELYFPDRDTMTAALNTEEGQRAGTMLHLVFKPQGYRFETFFADVYEEAGGSTPAPTDDEDSQSS
jgi:uncharacterized protein (TIGR02118 family)